MTEYELYEINKNLDEPISASDLSPQEAQELIEKNKENKKIPCKKTCKEIKKFKDNYFAYYDDVKDMSLKRQDW